MNAAATSVRMVDGATCHPIPTGMSEGTRPLHLPILTANVGTARLALAALNAALIVSMPFTIRATPLNGGYRTSSSSPCVRAGGPRPSAGVVDAPKGEMAGVAPNAVGAGAALGVARPKAGVEEPKRLPVAGAPKVGAGVAAGRVLKAPKAEEELAVAAFVSAPKGLAAAGAGAPNGVVAGAARAVALAWASASAVVRGIRGCAGGLYLSRTAASRLRAAARGSYPSCCRSRARWASMREC
eukprot:scaffold58630_cov30-Tisochrysis_lutea.AAC.3